MRFFYPRVVAHLRFRAAAYLVLIIALVPVGVVSWRVHLNVEARNEVRFHKLTAKVEEAIRENLEGMTANLRAVGGFLEARSITRSEWNTFVAKLELERRHPGTRSVGFAEKVEAETRAAFLRRVRAEAGPSYTITPPPTLPISFPTVFMTQFPTNMDVKLGWDSYSDKLRRAALDTVIKTGHPIVTEKLPYWNPGNHLTHGFTMFVPVNRRSASGHAGTSELAGVVFSSFIPQGMFDALSNKEFAGTLSVELFDGDTASDGALLGSRGVELSTAHSLRRTTPIRLFDHVFLIRVATLPAFGIAAERHLPFMVAACGLAFSFLLFGITWVQGTARSAAETLNRRLRESEEQLRAANVELKHKISEASTAEGLLAHERDLLRMLLDHSPDGIYFKDRESRFIKCGKAVLKHLGKSAPADATGKTDFDFFTEEHARAAFDLEQKIIRTGQPVVGLVEKETWPDGRVSWVLTSKMPLRDKHGAIIGTFGSSKDITELKTAELALAKEKELLTVTLRAIGDGVITADVEGRIVLFNHVAEKVTGWPQTEAVGKYLTEIFQTKDAETDTEILKRALQDAEPQWSREAVLVTRDGVERNISESVAPIVDCDGRKLGAVLVFRDVTEKLKTEAELLKASKLESIGVLAGGIAHDFNNILTVILGNISLARMSESAGTPIGESLEEAERASLRARELTQRLLTFAKGGAPIKKPLDLSALVRASAQDLQQKGITPEFFVSEGLWLVDADEAQISQVVQNLIGHARTSMSQDQRLDIHVLNKEITSDPLLLLKAGKYVRISIRDYGAGIQPENLTKIFEPYFGAKRQGSGLELATAYSIVRKHEGQIRVESISGQGTVFHIYLPAIAAPDILAPRAVARLSAPAQTISRHVLVMDDELPIRKLSVQMLQRIGCTAVTAADGAEAIEIYEAARRRGQPFDVVIMDLTVPNGMGGKETIRQLKALDPSVLAIVCSGYSTDPVMANFREFGFAGVVPKPYSAEDLAAALEQLFSNAPESPRAAAQVL